MKLDELLRDADIVGVVGVHGDPGVEVVDIAYDSRQVVPGSLFVAIGGERADGNDFVDQAIGNGAVVVVSEREPLSGVTWVRVAASRPALAALSARFFGYPARELCLVGITGTNGKTTTAHLVESIVTRAGRSVVLIGTAGHRGPGSSGLPALTTPESTDLERRFREAADAGATDAVMEVSSHAIAMDRVWGLDFDVAVFTNLSGDHLDFHGSVDAYFETKRRLFQGMGGPPPTVAVINNEDPYAGRLRDCGNDRILTFGLEAGADVYPREIRLDEDGLWGRFQTPEGDIEVESGLIGRPNASNVAAAVAVGVGLRLSGNVIAEGIGSLAGVPGRFERVEGGQPFRVIVDYAHTDDALERLLMAVREITSGRLIVVFGAGGERDRSKRPRMGAAAAKYSDLQIVTSDNPRGEDPAEIMKMIAVGLEQESGKYSCIPDRREAIRAAFRAAAAGDTVVVAGKGHETHQVIGGRVLPFDDRVVSRELLDELDAQ